MSYKTIPKRLTIGMVHRVVILVNSLPCKGSLQSILSPKKIVTRNKFRSPTICIGQYIQRLVGGTDGIEQERSIDALDLGQAENSIGHVVFKLDTQAVVSVKSKQWNENLWETTRGSTVN